MPLPGPDLARKLKSLTRDTVWFAGDAVPRTEGTSEHRGQALALRIAGELFT